MDMGSPWKALSDDNRRQIMLLLKEGHHHTYRNSRTF